MILELRVHEERSRLAASRRHAINPRNISCTARDPRGALDSASAGCVFFGRAWNL